MKIINYGIVIITVVVVVVVAVAVAVISNTIYYNSIIMAVIGVITGSLFLILSSSSNYSSLAINRDKNKGIEKFYKLLTTKFRKNLVSNKEDIVILLNSISREYSCDYSVAFILEDYLAYTTDKEDELSNENYNFLKTIIKEETEERPFSNIPEEERRLLSNINNSIKNNDLK